MGYRFQMDYTEITNWSSSRNIKKHKREDVMAKAKARNKNRKKQKKAC